MRAASTYRGLRRNLAFRSDQWFQARSANRKNLQGPFTCLLPSHCDINRRGELVPMRTIRVGGRRWDNTGLTVEKARLGMKVIWR